MKYDTQNFKLIKNEEIADGIFDWIVENPNLSKLAQPGQFAHVKVPGKTLRRPISICDATENTLRLVFQVKGENRDYVQNQNRGRSGNFSPSGQRF